VTQEKIKGVRKSFSF